MEVSPCTRTMPAMSPATSFVSSGLGGGGAALRGDETVSLDLRGELAAALRGWKPEKTRGVSMGSREEPDGRPVREAASLGRVNCCAETAGALSSGWLGMQNVFDGGDAADRFLREDAELQGESACEFAVEIDGAAAHASDDAGVLDFRTLEFDQNDGLLGAEEIGHHADDFEVELFDLVAGEDRVGVALHARSDLA